jgi:methylated-DNA-protein-cysteine methyltransferase-like protein
MLRAATEASAVAERVGGVVRKILLGRVATYGEIGEEIGCTARQVGWALRRAGPGRRLPWHRAVAAQGCIALPEEAGLEQRLRLEQEGVPFRGRRVWLERCHRDRPC